MGTVAAKFIDRNSNRAMTLIRAWDVYGDMHYISEENYNSPRAQIPLRFSTGLPFSWSPIKKINITIHRANIVLVRHLDGSYVAGSDDQPAPEEAAP